MGSKQYIRHALVTGGVEGNGQAIARKLVGHGFHVFFAGHNLAKLEDAKAQIGSDAITIIETDLWDRESIDRLHHQVSAVTDRLDMLVNAAGTFHRDPCKINLMEVNAHTKEYILETFEDMLPPRAWVANVSSQAAHFTIDDPRRMAMGSYSLSMKRINDLSLAFAATHPELHIYVANPTIDAAPEAVAEEFARKVIAHMGV